MCTAVEPLLKVDVQECVGLLTISRPKALNALNDQAWLVHLINHLSVLPYNIPSCVAQVMRELTDAAQRLDRDASVRCLVITGEGTKAFAAGRSLSTWGERGLSHVLKAF